MTIEELLALLKDESPSDETFATVMAVLPKILRRASRFFECREDYVCKYAFCLAFNSLPPKSYNEGNAFYIIGPMAAVASNMLHEAERPLSPTTIKQLETIRDTKAGAK